MLRIAGAFCGTCLVSGAHTDEMRRPDVRLVDVLVAGPDGMPSAPEDLDAWRSRVPGSPTIASDAAFALRAVLPPTFALPISVFVDPKTMRVTDVVPGPDPFGARKAPLFDGRFSPWEVDTFHAMAVPGAPPPDPSNAYANTIAAIDLGEALFQEKAFSPNEDVSCLSCHDPAKAYADGLPQAIGVARGDRNTPSLLTASYARAQFWDGRADSLWMQALAPIEAPAEIGGSRLRVAHTLFDHHRDAYETAFGPIPALDDATRFPADGMPGTPSWSAMAPADREEVTRIFVRAGKAIAAYERTLRPKANRFDRYIAGERDALSNFEKDGLHVFLTAGCAQCHHGPRLTDDAFHVVGFPTGRADGAPDRGYIDGAATLAASEFSRSGPHSDAPAPRPPRPPMPAMLGAFRTPSLRGLPRTAPYGHGGTFATIEDVVHFYARGAPPDRGPTAGQVAPLFVPFEADAEAKLAAFLRVLE